MLTTNTKSKPSPLVRSLLTLAFACAALLPAAVSAQTPATFANRSPVLESSDKRFSQRSASFVLPSSASSNLALAPLASGELQHAEKVQTQHPQGRRVAVTRDLGALKNTILLRDLSWQTAQNGNWVSKLQLTSPQAHGLRLQVSNIAEAANRHVNVRLQGSRVPGLIEGPQSLGSSPDSQQWLAWTEGETVTAEFELSSQFKPSALSVTISSVAHFDKDITKAGVCDRDIACEPANTEIELASRSTATILYREFGIFWSCVGTLMGHLDPVTTKTLMLTGGQCAATAEAAATVSTLWFDQKSTCGGTVRDSRYRQVTGGAAVAARDIDADMTLLELFGRPATGALRSGWDLSTMASNGTNTVTIHQPGTSSKSVSLGRSLSFVQGANPNKLSYVAISQYENAPAGDAIGAGLLVYGTDGELRVRGAQGATTQRGASCMATAVYGRLDLATPIGNALRGIVAPPSPPPTVINPEFLRGWWWDASAGGQGFGVDVRNGRLFIGGFLYDAAGNPIWFASSGTISSNGLFSGVMQQYSGGQTLNGAYVRPAASITAGNVSIRFTTELAAVMTWPGGTKNLSAFPIVPGGLSLPNPLGTPERGWYVSLGEDGRGWMLEVQGDNLFMAGFMYDATGYPVWYVTSGKMSSPTAYSGVWVKYGGGQTYTSAYVSPRITDALVGNVSLAFPTTTTANMRLPNGRVIPLVRFTNF